MNLQQTIEKQTADIEAALKENTEEHYR